MFNFPTFQIADFPLQTAAQSDRGRGVGTLPLIKMNLMISIIVLIGVSLMLLRIVDYLFV